jgi:hypothetical protein
MQKAVQEAVTPEHAQALIRVVLKQGLQGNLQAARIVLDRVCGRPQDGRGDGEHIDIGLPNLRTAANCTAAIDVIIASMTAGTVDLPTAKFLLDAVERRRKAIETLEHEQRLTDLEKAASVVDFGRRN